MWQDRCATEIRCTLDGGREDGGIVPVTDLAVAVLAGKRLAGGRRRTRDAGIRKPPEIAGVGKDAD